MNNDQKNLEKLNQIAKNAYAPYSNFSVAALFEKEDGTNFWGINIENASHPNGTCAERVAIYSAINNGIVLNDVKVIHIFSPNSNQYLSPCGECRQTIGEHIDSDVEIRMYKKDGQFISKKFKEIFPFVIDSKNIKGIE